MQFRALRFQSTNVGNRMNPCHRWQRAVLEQALAGLQRMGAAAT